MAASNNVKLLLWKWWTLTFMEAWWRMLKRGFQYKLYYSFSYFYLPLSTSFEMPDNTIFVLLRMYRIVPIMKRKSQLCLISNACCKYWYNKKMIYLYVGVIAHFLVCLWWMLKHYPSINVKIGLPPGWLQTRPLKCERRPVYPIPFEFCQAWSILFFSLTMIFEIYLRNANS